MGKDQESAFEIVCEMLTRSDRCGTVHGRFPDREPTEDERGALDRAWASAQEHSEKLTTGNMPHQRWHPFARNSSPAK